MMGFLMGLGKPCSTRTVQRAEKEAVELRLVKITRRWLKSNLYHVLCLEERLSTNPNPECRIEQNDSVQNNVRNACKKPLCESRNPYRVARVIFSDVCEMMPHLAEKNRGFFKRIANTVNYETAQDALRFVKQSVLEGELTGDLVKNPSGLMTWFLRRAGALT